MAHAQGIDRVPTLQATAVEGFCKAFPSQEMVSFESSRGRGDLATAKLIRMVVSLDSALESMLGMEISELDGNPLALAADFMETPLWSLGQSGWPARPQSGRTEAWLNLMAHWRWWMGSDKPLRSSMPCVSPCIRSNPRKWGAVLFSLTIHAWRRGP